MRVDLTNRVALITGAAAGIGRSIAIALAANGARVAINDVADGHQTCDEIRANGGEAKFYPADVSDVNAVNSMVAEVESEMGGIRILVNNAGINVGANRLPIHQVDDTDWHRIISVDLHGVFYCSRAVSKKMVERRQGTIINISSVFGIVPARLQCAYAAAKSAVVNFTRSHALEVGSYGLRVNAVAPGSILTEGTKSLFYNPEQKERANSLLSHIPLRTPGEPNDIASAVLYLASDDAKYVTGHVLVVDGGWTAGFSRDW